jgi:hypothetical protein
MDSRYKRENMPLAEESNDIAFHKFACFKYPGNYSKNSTLITDLYFTSELERLTAIKVYKSHNKANADKKEAIIADENKDQTDGEFAVKNGEYYVAK